jgi:hypothetical protein
MVAYIIETLGLIADPTCGELERAFFLPAMTWLGEDPNVEHIEGGAIDLDALIKALPPEEERPKSESSSSKQQSDGPSSKQQQQKKTSGSQQQNDASSQRQKDSQQKQEQQQQAGTGLPDYYQDVLSVIPNDDREIWRNVGMGIHHATNGSDDGFAIWHKWAETSSLNDLVADQATWKNLKPDRDGQKVITWATVGTWRDSTGWKGAVAWPEVNRNGSPVSDSVPNIEAALKYQGVALYYDKFKDKPIVEGRGDLTDSMLRKFWLDAYQDGLRCKKEFFYDTVLYLGDRDARHPVKEYLAEVQPTWDGVPRIDTMLVDYCGAEDTEFNRAAAACWMIGAVRRVRRPGSKFDTMLVLEGDEGKSKSTFCKVLAGEAHFSDCLPIDAESKIVIEQTRGRWIIEFAELKGIKEKDVNGVKVFLSRTEDAARGAWGKVRSDVPRQFVTFGSTNDTQYLVGTTGNRRFWPVAVETIDTEAVKRDRDQLWAEAASREAKGESAFLPERLWETARAVQESRRMKTPMEELLTDKIGDITDGIIKVTDLYAAVGYKEEDIAKISATHGALIKTLMGRLGWTYGGRLIIAGKKITAYVRDDRDRLWCWSPGSKEFDAIYLDPTKKPKPKSKANGFGAAEHVH